MNIVVYQCEHVERFDLGGATAVRTFLELFSRPEYLGSAVVVVDRDLRNRRAFRKLGFDKSPIVLSGESIVRAIRPLYDASYCRSGANVFYAPINSETFEASLRATGKFLDIASEDLDLDDAGVDDFESVFVESGRLAVLRNVIPPGSRVFSFIHDAPSMFAFNVPQTDGWQG